MKKNIPPDNTIHRLLFAAAKQAHVGIDHWFARQNMGVTPLQFGILRAVVKENMTLNELARRMMFKPPSVLPSLDLLERRGYILRRNDPHDRRKIHIFTTAKGKRVVARVVSARSPDPLRAAFSKMSVAKRKKLTNLLTELNSLMQKQANNSVIK